ncbi:uncharacterized protein [Halyomorpha halys]|nr:uncharacterized protein LOC106680586 isoform X2 [Halyomorpha halys]
MKNYIGSLLAIATMVAYSSASTNCTQPMEMKRKHDSKTLLHKYRCNQEVHYEDLQTEPEILYDGHLPHGYNYTLLLLENNNNTGSYKIHWFLTDITPVNKSLTSMNKTIIEGYRAPINKTNGYTVLVYRHPDSLLLKPPSNTEMDNFIPTSWAAPIQNIYLENNATFQVIGKNASRHHSSGTIHHHTPAQTHPITYQTYPTVPADQPKTSTSRPQYVTQKITEKSPGYNSYNATNSINTHHNSPSHTHKSGASSNVCCVTIILIPLISVITKVIY